MPPKSLINRQKKRGRLIKKYQANRAAYLKTIRDPNSTAEEVWEARKKLQALPRNSSPVRSNNLCQLTGRSRSVYRNFELCRHKLREKGMRGEIPGLIKASW
jgi:small subunit ribosomal protein S14